ncbi:MAG: polysaccharide biosynthesis/export family protein [Gammaproteobacteria bacterium]|nr:polysaccharide biosynthesis/export family protein [Gammaproteobacteria bacterium]
MLFSSARAVVAIALPLILAGCSIPGSNMKLDSGEAAPDVESQIEIKAITPSLVVQLSDQNDAPRATSNESLEAQLAQFDYRIGVGDVLNVTIWDHPELTIPAGSFRSAEDSGNWVHADGTIFYPYIGRVPVVGKTVNEVRDLIAEKLSRFIESPQVDVSISAFRSQRVYLTGEVLVPGPQPISNVPLTLVDALNNSGGVAEFADWRRVTVSRNGQDMAVDLRALMQFGDLSQNLLLQHGDIVHVPRNDNSQVFVMGAVNQTSVLAFGRNPMSLTEALAQAEGLNESIADASGVFVIRGNDSGDKLATVYQLNLENASALVLASRFALEPNDVVYIATEPVAVWNRLIAQILPTTQAIYYTGRIYDDFN